VEQIRTRVFRFGAFELDARAGELRKHDIRIRLQEQPFRILLMLLENPGEVVLREEIRKRLWPNDTIVEFDHSINAAIRRLRDALGESADDPRFVETAERRGYRFLGQVEVVAAAGPAMPDTALLDFSDLIGKALSHYRVLEKIGAGGMGEVYRARDISLDRVVAVKVLPPDKVADPERKRRFVQEAKAASALNHPNIITIHEFAEELGTQFIVMEYVQGKPLDQLIRHKEFSCAQCI
jgi:DNA-binding winged helix-turn-helix (wHTH) protein